VTVFRGVHQINLDGKGRMAMPTRYRDAIAASDEGQLIVTLHPQARCLLVYPLSNWLAIEQQIQNLPTINNAVHAGIKRRLLGNASDVEIDGAGRVLLPAKLREYTRLEKKMVLVGQTDKFELWDEELWDQQMEQVSDDVNSGEVSEAVLSLNL
jgi:MraZ protein